MLRPDGLALRAAAAAAQADACSSTLQIIHTIKTKRANTLQNTAKTFHSSEKLIQTSNTVSGFRLRLKDNSFSWMRATVRTIVRIQQTGIEDTICGDTTGRQRSLSR
jgi:hypothetical protein